MNIEPQHTRFFYVQPHAWWGRRRFLPRGNSLQVQETGLVVQGYLQKLSLAPFDVFFRSILSEWTTVTVPYSRILFLKVKSFIAWRVLAIILAWLPLFLLLLAAFMAPRRGWDTFPFVPAALLASFGLILSLYVNWALAARHYLLFEEPAGSLAMLCFRIKKPELRRRFVELIESHRAASRGLPPLYSGESRKEGQTTGARVSSAPRRVFHQAQSSRPPEKLRYVAPLAVGLILGGMALAGGQPEPNKNADAARALQASARSAKLINQKLELQGTLVDGQPLDWNSYRGKVVLVSLLDTSSPDGRKEWLDLLGTYALRKDQGFEVLGVALDKDRDRLDLFLKTVRIPWQCVHDSSATAGSAGPIAARLGIVPGALLHNLVVDRDGKIVAMSASRPETEALLEMYLVPPTVPDFPEALKLPTLKLPTLAKLPRQRAQALPAAQIPPPETPAWVTILVAALGGVLLVPFALFVAYQAHQRGYNCVIWFLAGLVSFNPLFPLVALALLPFRSRQALRLMERNALNAKLSEAAPEAAARESAHVQHAAHAGPAMAGSTEDFPAMSRNEAHR